MRQPFGVHISTEHPPFAHTPRPLRAPRAQRFLLAFLFGALLLGGAVAQHDHEHEAPVADPGSLGEQLTRSTVVEHAGVSFDIGVVWATPAFFAAEMPEAAATWQPANGMVFLVDETTHSEDLPEASVADGVVLLAGGDMLLPEQVEVTSPEPHHRLTTLRFALSPYRDGDVILRFASGEELSWSPGIWFGLAPDEQIIEVAANDEGFAPSEIVVEAGVPLVFVFQNSSDVEHHFHIMDLEPQDLRWFLLEQHDIDAFDLALLETAERSGGHMCTSASGICRLGTNVHLHANPQQFDAVGFVAPKPGRYLIVCPLHAEMRAELVVR